VAAFVALIYHDLGCSSVIADGGLPAEVYLGGV